VSPLSICKCRIDAGSANRPRCDDARIRIDSGTRWLYCMYLYIIVLTLFTLQFLRLDRSQELFQPQSFYLV
jgi:hypothetical protein